MENFFARYKNPLILMAVLFIQIVALATQVKRPDGSKPGPSGSTRLIRVWTVTAITPFERALVATGHFFRSTWRDYIDLHDVRKQNLELQEEMARMRLEQARLKASADESQRLRALLDFKERYVGETVAAQVIGTSGSDSLRTIAIDKGSHAGIQPDMAVITPDGIVGKVKEVFPLSSAVLLINDRDSGAGVILQNSRLHGILRGTGPGELIISDVMSDEKVDVGETVVTSGGDRVYPKGLAAGTVTHVGNDADLGPFLAIKIKPAANLDRLEEVLVVTRIVAEAPVVTGDTKLPSASRAETPGNASAAPKGSAGVVPPAANVVSKDRAPTGATLANPGSTPAKNNPGSTSANKIETPANASAAPKSNAGVGPSAANGVSKDRTHTDSTLANPGSTPAKKKKPVVTPSPASNSQDSPTVTPVESSQPERTGKPKPQPSPASNGEKPPR
jgi:rod shape-determining protein MreC